jgi:hypothetical protein
MGGGMVRYGQTVRGIDVDLNEVDEERRTM